MGKSVSRNGPCRINLAAMERILFLLSGQISGTADEELT
jgi:hypothetical protein